MIAKKYNFANKAIEFLSSVAIETQHNLILKKVAIAKIAKIIIFKLFLKNQSIEAGF